MKPRLPLIAIPGKTSVYPLGVIPKPGGTTIPLLRFSERGLDLSSEGREGLAIVGHGEGRRRLVQVSMAGASLSTLLVVLRRVLTVFRPAHHHPLSLLPPDPLGQEQVPSSNTLARSFSLHIQYQRLPRPSRPTPHVLPSIRQWGSTLR